MEWMLNKTWKPSMSIETDASIICPLSECQNQGPWSKTERLMHINCLEILAAMLAMKYFTMMKQDILIYLRLDKQLP